MRKIAIFITTFLTLISCSNNKSSVNMKEAEKWASELLKSVGITIPFHSSVNFVELKRQYEANKSIWDASFEFLAKKCNELDTMTEFGTFDIISKDCYSTLSEYIPKPEAETKFEGHKKYIDIQVTQGPVMWGICPSDSPSLEVLSEYDSSKDNGFYQSLGAKTYKQGADEKCIFVFFPEDLHNPSYAVDGVQYDTPLKKIVIKVKHSE